MWIIILIIAFIVLGPALGKVMRGELTNSPYRPPLKHTAKTAEISCYAVTDAPYRPRLSKQERLLARERYAALTALTHELKLSRRQLELAKVQRKIAEERAKEDALLQSQIDTGMSQAE